MLCTVLSGLCLSSTSNHILHEVIMKQDVTCSSHHNMWCVLYLSLCNFFSKWNKFKVTYSWYWLKWPWILPLFFTLTRAKTTKLIILNDASTHICVIRYTSHNFNDNCLGNLTLLTETEKKYTANITWGTHRISKELHYSFSYPISSWPCIVTTVVRINIRSLAGSFSAFHQD